MNFEGKVAVVTGGGAGIGKSVAEAFAENGASVAVLDINLPAAEQTTQRIRTSGGKACAVWVDAGEEESVIEAFQKVKSSFTSIHILVNVAGVELYKDFLDISGAEWDRQLAVNLKSVYLCCHQAIPYMIRAGEGSIVNTASVQALATTGRISAYAAAKAGILGMTRDLARDFGKYNIRINSICPGCIDTPMMNRTLDGMADPKSFLAELSTGIPLQRLGMPRDIANVALFLCSPLSAYVTGISVTVDGGLMAKLPLPA